MDSNNGLTKEAVMEMTLSITRGSEKQVTWATSIAQGWINTINGEIAEVALRNDPLLADYSEQLVVMRQRLIAGINTWSAAQIIDYRTNNYGMEAILRARKAVAK